MKLQQLFTNIPVRILQPSDLPDVEIQMICFDSRKVAPGSLFVALQGFSMDGHRYIPDAVKRGASAIVGMQDLRIEADTPYIQVDDSRKALAYLSAAWHDHPSRKMTMIGVTGTDGKTTT
ncbi:MAG: Mur ligase domain-containing protein, partial [Anaerolineaceae bacterium]